MANNRPIHSIKSCGLDVAIWENNFKDGTSYSVTIQRSYKVESEGWKQTGFLRKTDLLLAARLIEQAFDYINGIKVDKAGTTNDEF